jgi:hypothetical protein
VAGAGRGRGWRGRHARKASKREVGGGGVRGKRASTSCVV